MKFSINFVFQILQQQKNFGRWAAQWESILKMCEKKQGFKYTGQSLELGQ